jgi:HAD superfamily hydrolase (TIGR01509 family)
MPVYDAILFDFDGVLIDSEPVHFECWREILAEFGIDFQWDTYRRECIGVADHAIIASMCSQANPPLAFEALWPQYPRKQRKFRERVGAAPPFISGLDELFKSLKNYKLAVVSSSGRSEVEPLLVTARLREYLGTLVCGDDVTRHKPAPDPYLLAARHLGAARPLVVEDSQAGVESARAAGFDVLHVPECATMPVLLRKRLSEQTRTG